MVCLLLYGPFLVILCAIFYKGLGLGVQGQSERSQPVSQSSPQHTYTY